MNSCSRLIRNVAITAAGYTAVRAALAFSRRYDFHQSLSGNHGGGSRGLGPRAQLATSLDAGSVQQMPSARDAEELASAANELRERASFVATYTCDLSQANEITKCFSRSASAARSAPSMCSSTTASIIEVGPVETMNLDDYEHAMAVHFSATDLHGTRAARHASPRRRSDRQYFLDRRRDRRASYGTL